MYRTDTVIATLRGWKTEWLTQMGFTVADSIDAFRRPDDDRAYIPLGQLGAALRDVDALLWRT
ncbi:hypothetical protein ACXDF8_22150 [Mycolicibacterium sp. CBM1]